MNHNRTDENTDELSQLNWIISGYNLASATFIPIFGQFADIFGRYIVLQAASVILILGSALCAAAPTTNLPLLLAGRGLQGCGSAGLLILVKTILADKVSLRENAKNNTIFTFVGGIGYGLGPTIGGYLTAVSWRWCFIVNIPLGVVSLIVLHFSTRKILLSPQDFHGLEEENTRMSRSATFWKRIATVDFSGSLLFLAGMALVILSLTWAGAVYRWAAAQVLVSLILGLILMVAFVVWEYSLLPGKALAVKHPQWRPMIPIRLLWTRNTGLLIYINMITGMGNSCERRAVL